MHRSIVLLIICLLLFPSYALSETDVLNFNRTATMNLLLDQAMSRDIIAGGVVVIGNREGILATTARGSLNGLAGSALLDEHTIFDVASLTKVVATTTAVMKLVDEGKIGLNDSVTRWFPEFSRHGGDEISILTLLTHTSGLWDFDLENDQPMQGAILKAAAEKDRQPPGTSFNYADINFILLGEIVKRVSGRPLDVYSREEIFLPLQATETMFLPPDGLQQKIAPTAGLQSGIVQDRNARRLGGVAGHAGLFSSAHDLASFARLLIGNGMIDGKRILSEQVVKEMTTPYTFRNGTVTRGLGWDMESPYSAPKGMLFSDASYGHTGYSGSSIWIDPRRDLFVILLTNRLNYKNTTVFNDLRRNISTLAAAGFRTGVEDLGLPLEAALGTGNLFRETPRLITAAKPARRAKVRLVASLDDRHSTSYHRDAKKKSKKMKKKHAGKIRRA